MAWLVGLCLAAALLSAVEAWRVSPSILGCQSWRTCSPTPSSHVRSRTPSRLRRFMNAAELQSAVTLETIPSCGTLQYDFDVSAALSALERCRVDSITRLESILAKSEGNLTVTNAKEFVEGLTTTGREYLTCRFPPEILSLAVDGNLNEVLDPLPPPALFAESIYRPLLWTQRDHWQLLRPYAPQFLLALGGCGFSFESHARVCRAAVLQWAQLMQLSGLRARGASPLLLAQFPEQSTSADSPSNNPNQELSHTSALEWDAAGKVTAASVQCALIGLQLLCARPQDLPHFARDMALDSLSRVIASNPSEEEREAARDSVQMLLSIGVDPMLIPDELRQL